MQQVHARHGQFTVAPLPGPHDAPVRRTGALTLLTVYLVLLLGVPAQLVFGPLGALGTPALMLAFLLLGWWASSCLVPGARPGAGFQPVRIAVLVYLGAVLPSYAMATWRVADPLEVSGGDRSLLTLLAACGIACLVADGIADRQGLDALLRRLTWLAAAVGAVGIFQFVTGVDITRYYLSIPGLSENQSFTTIQDRSSLRRISATASHPIEFGVVLSMALPLALHYAFAPGVRRSRVNWVPVVLIGAAIPMSISRSATLACIVAGVVLFAGWTGRQRTRALIAVPVFLVVMRLLIPGLLGTIKSLFTNLGNDPSIQGRTNDYAEVATYVQQSPWFGRGAGTFLPSAYFTLDNQYLGQLVETGVVGLLGLCGLFVVGFLTARGARHRASDAVTRDLGQALAASIAVPAVTFATFDGFGFPVVTGMTFVVLGAAGALWRVQLRTAPSPRGGTGPDPVGTLPRLAKRPRPPLRERILAGEKPTE